MLTLSLVPDTVKAIRFSIVKCIDILFLYILIQMYRCFIHIYIYHGHILKY